MFNKFSSNSFSMRLFSLFIHNLSELPDIHNAIFQIVYYKHLLF